MNTTYYDDQLARVGTPQQGKVSIKLLHDRGAFTNWLSLNDESALVLIEWLKNNFNKTK